MRVFERVCEAIATDADGIAQAQQPGAAGNLTLNGVAVVTENGNAPAGIGSAVLDPPRKVTITSVGNDSAVNFTVYGTDRSGKLIQEVVVGSNASITATVRLFASVTRVAVDAATAGNVTIGWDDTSYSPWLPLGNSMGPAGFRIITVGNDSEGAPMIIEVTSKNILREGEMDGDYPGDGEIQQILDPATNVEFAGDAESVCLVPYTAVRITCSGNGTSIKLRVNPNYTA